MTLNREHALELLALLAVIALVQWPQNQDPPFDSKAAYSAATIPTASKFTEADDREPRHRLDPIALLQASVPEDWRVELPPYAQASRPALRC